MPRGQGLKKIKINFSKVKDMTLGELYGTDNVPVSDLNKKLWALIKKEGLRQPDSKEKFYGDPDPDLNVSVTQSNPDINITEVK